jgi:transcriptional regulator with XRE-family HTH domain
MSLGSNIKDQRKKRRMSLTEVATLAQIPIPNLSEIEHDKRTPSIGALNRIARVLRVKSSYLMRGEGA